MNKDVTGLILAAGKPHEDLSSVFGDTSTGLIPVNGKPAIFYIIEGFIEIGITDVLISVDYQKDKIKKLVSERFSQKLDLEFVESDMTKDPGYSLLLLLKKAENDGPFLLNLADTLTTESYNNFLKDQNTVFTSSEVDFLDRWCGVETNEEGEVKNFFESENERNEVVSGIYFLENTSSLEVKLKDCEISHILKKLDNIRAERIKHWYDTGHLNKYYESKKQFLQTRSFNSVEFNNKLSTIKKKSKRGNVLKDEILWYLTLPEELKAVAPRILSYSFDQDVSLQLEYYGYPTVSEYWLFGNFSLTVWKRVLSKVFDYIELFNSKNGEVRKEDYEEMYWQKTKNRVQSIKDSEIRKLLEKEKLLVNGQEVLGWPDLKWKIKKMAIDDLYDRDHNSIIHGDLHFGNLLFDIKNGILRLLDPRGSWGDNILYGDIKYDLAKLRHSVSGKFDFITNNMFDLHSTKNEINFKFKLFEKVHKDTAKYLDKRLKDQEILKEVKFIEGLLFLSMIPLHPESTEKQKVMLGTAMKYLNSL